MTREDDRERAKRARSEDDRGAGPVALAIVAAAAVSFALVVAVLVGCALIFVYFFSSYLLAHVVRLVRLPLRRLLPGRRRPASRASRTASSLATRLGRALRTWQ